MMICAQKATFTFMDYKAFKVSASFSAPSEWVDDYEGVILWWQVIIGLFSGNFDQNLQLSSSLLWHDQHQWSAHHYIQDRLVKDQNTQLWTVFDGIEEDTMMMMMGSNKGCRKSLSSSFGKPKTPRLGISGIDYVNGLAHHGYNHFHMSGGTGGGGGIVASILAGTVTEGKLESQPRLQSIEMVQQQSQQNNHLDAINKTNSVDRGGGCKMKRKKLQPFEPNYYFDSDFDSEDGSGGGGRRRGSTTSCSPSIVSRFLRLSRRKSSTSSKSSSRKNSQSQVEKEDQSSIKSQVLM